MKMNWYFNLSAMNKIYLTLAASIGVMVLVGGLGISSMSKVDGMLETLYERDMKGVVALKDANADLIYAGREIRQLILDATDAAKEKNFQKLKLYDQRFSQNLDIYEKTVTTDRERELLAKARDGMKRYMVAVYASADAARSGKGIPEATRLVVSGGSARESADAAMIELSKIKDQTGQSTYEESDRVCAKSRSNIIALMAGGALVALVFGWFVGRCIANPLAKAVAVCESVAKGDYSRRLDVDTKDEVGRMAVALNQSIDASVKMMDDIKVAAEREKELQARRAEEERKAAEAENRRKAEESERERQRLAAERKAEEERAAKEREAAAIEQAKAEELRRKVDQLLVVVRAAAQGDLTKHVNVEGDDPIDELAGGIKQMLGDLSGVIGQVTESAAQFNEGARVIAESSQALAHASQTQSAGVEQMTASIEELARSIESVRDRAKEADTVALNASQLAEQGGQAVRKSVESMGLIRTSSQQIGEIIQVISEIASQTNLLALNAAIEAARAGEHGMGFAVVADEVRKLAERSNQAAREISSLIKESTARVEEGSQLSEQTGVSLQQIVRAVEATAAKIAEIATATVQQASNAKEVSQAIQGVSQVTEQTAAGSEEMASSSEELGAQAGALRDLVCRFRLEQVR